MIVPIRKYPQVESKNKSGIDRLVLNLYSLFLIISPFYLWDSGLPQIADIIMVLLILIIMMSSINKIMIQKSSKEIMTLGLVFISYVTFANLIWLIILSGSIRFILTSAFYIYNYLVMIVVIILCNKHTKSFLKATYISITISSFIQLIIFLSSGGFTGRRAVASFNNPNQLGYYALIVLALLVITSRRIQVNGKVFMLGISSSFVLVLASLSNGAIISYISLLLVFFVRKTHNKKVKRRVIIITLVGIISIMYINATTNFIKDSNLYNSLRIRLETTSAKIESSSETRGYYRISEYPQYWVLGSGEGEYSRFENSQIEFHSTLGNIQVSYGLLGLSLFLGLIFVVLKNDKFTSWDVLFFILLGYGLSHNGIRNSLLWLLLGIVGTQLPNLEKLKGESEVPNE